MSRADDLADLRERHAAYIARVKANGKPVITFSAPCCGKEIETPAAPAGVVWDTLATCQHCGALYLKVTTGDAVEATAPPKDPK